MKFIIGYLVVIAYLFWQDIINAIHDKTPKTYDDLMKLPAFTEDEKFQQYIKDKENEVG